MKYPTFLTYKFIFFVGTKFDTIIIIHLYLNWIILLTHFFCIGQAPNIAPF